MEELEDVKIIKSEECRMRQRKREIVGESSSYEGDVRREGRSIVIHHKCKLKLGFQEPRTERHASKQANKLRGLSPKRTIPNERPPLGEVSANFFG
jgi:hypothetical protein